MKLRTLGIMVSDRKVMEVIAEAQFIGVQLLRKVLRGNQWRVKKVDAEGEEQSVQ